MAARQKAVLAEEQYVAALEHIIERDFFPELPQLRRQDDPDAQEQEADAAIARTPLGTASTLVATRPSASSWDQPTPGRGTVDALQRVPDDSDQPPGAAPRTSDLTLNQFVATHTSEDNAAFSELQAQSIEEHQRRYFWAYDSESPQLDAKLHLLKDGTWISEQQRLLADQALAPKGPIDRRPSAPETWPHHARNALLFSPPPRILEDRAEAASASTSVLKLENGRNADSLFAAAKTRVGTAPRAKKETVYANSRFPSTPEEKPRVRFPELEASTEDQALVPMTPQIAPGIDASPLMTWGSIEATPLLLDGSATPAPRSRGPGFEIKDNSKREQVADRLEQQARQRKAQQFRASSLTPLVRGRKRPLSTTTPSRTESIRNRLSSIRTGPRTPFGSDAELRASYATPLRPPRHPTSQRRR